jgi:hypothetical protein
MLAHEDGRKSEQGRASTGGNEILHRAGAHEQDELSGTKRGRAIWGANRQGEDRAGGPGLAAHERCFDPAGNRYRAPVAEHGGELSDEDSGGGTKMAVKRKSAG